MLLKHSKCRNEPGFSIMSADDSSTFDVPTTNADGCSEKENMTIAVSHHTVGTYFGLPYQDHNYGAPPPPTPPSCSPQLSPIHVSPIVETETISIVTTTLPSEEVNEISITRCVCGFEHDDEYMICCDKCLVWQHVDCMGLDRSKMPETYLCEQCEPRKVDRHKAKLLQAKKKVVLPEKLIFTETSDSEEDQPNQNSETSKSRTQKSHVKKKSDDEKEAKPELPVLKKGRGSPSKHSKERMEMKRSKLRRRTKSRTDSTCATDEEAQDAWKCSMEWPKRKLEGSIDNQYSEEIHSLATSLKSQTDEQKYCKQLQAQLCKVVEFESYMKLVAISDIARDQVIIEFKGHFTSASLFHEKHPAFKHRLFPYVLFYKLRPNEELCVDATSYKCDAKHVRRSCQPNSEVHHFVVNGSLHLYILSIKDIKKDEEITIPFDAEYNLGISDITCACDSEKCQFEARTKSFASDSSEKRRKVRKSHISTDEDSNQSCGPSPMKLKNASAKSPPSIAKMNVAMSAVPLEGCEVKIVSEEQETEDAVKERKKKLTREERKLDAIMRAFDQMEKAAKRRQQALDRMAQQKANNTQKCDESPEKQEGATQQTVKEEEPPVPLSSSVIPENVSVDEERSNSNPTVKQKKGKRRRGSGTSSRKRTRTNSGGSDVFVAEDTSNVPETAILNPLTSSSTETSDSTFVSSSESTTPVQQPVVSPVFPKTKRILHQEWLQEKVESTASSSPPCPLPIHKEVSYSALAVSPTCYVRCTKDSPSSGGISAAHLRRSSISGHCRHPSGQGSAKKRWLRQAMCDSEPWEGDSVAVDAMNGSTSPLHSVCFSPHAQIDMGSPVVSPLDDVVTPLKKRRLLRKSVESLSSPRSPTTESTGASSWMSPDQSSCEPIADSLIDSTGSSESSKALEVINVQGSVTVAGKCIQTGNGLGKHLLKSLRENWIMNDSRLKSGDSSLQNVSKNSDVDASEVHLQNKFSNSETKFTNELVTKHPEGNHISDDESHKNIKVNAVKKLHSESLTQVDAKSASVRSENAVLLCSTGHDSTSHPHHREMLQNHVEKASFSCGLNSGVDVFAQEEREVSNKGSTVEPSICDVNHSSKPVVTDGKICRKDKLLSSSQHAEILARADDSCSSKTLQVQLEHGKGNDASAACSQTAILEGATKVNNYVQNTSYAQASISKKCASSNVSSPVNMSVSHNSNSCSVFVNSELSGNKMKVMSTETVPTTIVKSDVEVVQQKESKVSGSEGFENQQDKCSAVVVPTPPKRKVSLSEYRQRKRDNPNNSQITNNGGMKSNNCVLMPSDVAATGESEIKLASLPLFQNAEQSAVLKHEKAKVANEKFHKTSKEVCGNIFETQQTDDIPGQRENLTERLKREFGLEEDSDGKKKDGSKCKKNESPASKISPEIAPILSLCTQLPPPPPPPPPSAAIPLVNTNCSTAPPPFNYTSQQAFMVPQIPSNQYISAQTMLGCQTIMPVIHTAPPTLQASCSYVGNLHTSVTRPPYPPVNNPGFATLTQHIPHMPLPPSYPPPPFQSRVYK